MKNRIFIVVSILLLVLAVLAGIYFYQIKTRNAVEQLAEEKKMINILLAGNNEYRERTFSFYAIVSINPENGNIGITFIPPDFKVKLDDEGNKTAKIKDMDLIYFEKVRKSLWRDLKMNVPFYFEIYSPDVIRIVDMLEGVELFFLDQQMDMKNVSFGLNYFDGRKAMQYINSVEQNSIYLKYDRIQDLLLTLYYNREEKKKFFNVEFMTEILRTLQTNLLPQELMSLGAYIFKGGNVFSTIVPGGIEQGYYVVDDITYKIYEKEFLTPLVIGEEGDPVIKIKILNGTDIPGLARKVRNTLNRDGLNVVEFGTSPFRKMDHSLIISRKGDLNAVRKVSELTGINSIHYIVDNSLLHNILIILGEDMTK